MTRARSLTVLFIAGWLGFLRSGWAHAINTLGRTVLSLARDTFDIADGLIDSAGCIRRSREEKDLPALFGLFKIGYLPEGVHIVGYARTKMSEEEFHKRGVSYIKDADDPETAKKLEEFKNVMSYVSGQYEGDEGYSALTRPWRRSRASTRPKSLRRNCYTPNGTNRIIVEKPLQGLESCRQMMSSLKKEWTEEETFRIDHYLGRNARVEQQAIRACRLRSRSLCTEGRGGYFDEFGIIRDIQQNHLLQVLSILTMERPVRSLRDIRDEKVRRESMCAISRAVPDMHARIYRSKSCVPIPPSPRRRVARQYVAANGKPDTSTTRRCRKIRIFKDIARNELVLRIQPSERSMSRSTPRRRGFTLGDSDRDDLTYKRRFTETKIPEAYEALILTRSRAIIPTFVRDDELDVACEGRDGPHRDPNRTRMDRVGPRSSTALLASTDTNVRMPDTRIGPYHDGGGIRRRQDELALDRLDRLIAKNKDKRVWPEATRRNTSEERGGRGGRERLHPGMELHPTRVRRLRNLTTHRRTLDRWPSRQKLRESAHRTPLGRLIWEPPLHPHHLLLLCHHPLSCHTLPTIPIYLYPEHTAPHSTDAHAHDNHGTSNDADTHSDTATPIGPATSAAMCALSPACGSADHTQLRTHTMLETHDTGKGGTAGPSRPSELDSHPGVTFTPAHSALSDSPSPLRGRVVKLDVTVSKLLETPLNTPDDESTAPIDPRPQTVHPRSSPPDPTPDDSDSDSSSQSPPRPRKKLRTHPPAHTSTGIPDPPSTPSFEKELLNELTCEICFMLLCNPITTPCQHTFCSTCLERSLDHSTKCPLCRLDLPPNSYFYQHAHNEVITQIIAKAFPTLLEERVAAAETDGRDSRLDTPIFVCQLSYPGMPTLLHFFEPRYRLMLRRCLASATPRFGMVMPRQNANNTDGNDYGTMLEIKNVQMLSDGRSMVETYGTFRFRILERGTLDGYLVGRTESEGDITLRGIERSNQELVNICRRFLDQLRNGTAPWVVQRLNNTYGPMPADVASFGFWVALVLPIDEQEKAKLLPIRSPRMRLRLVVHWIEQLNNNWWFSSGSPAPLTLAYTGRGASFNFFGDDLFKNFWDGRVKAFLGINV
ncbi:ATP-dependent protease La (LON) substrate-binding domain [Rhizoctonia solani]|uniref:glucose-6-phosphate dehydrogenase (NADP(+)) n=1 Tax=Rhizoctonia solani TaxID=456999 RepID=A0A8H7IIU8_9AGAM|nr:ATP-dependent protease La (LON) substrate-binding domain [Rhizoctonia solani]